MFSLFKTHFMWRARALFDARYDDMALHYRLPLVVNAIGLRLPIASHGDMVLHLHRLRVALMGRGITGVDPQIVAVDLPAQVQRVWVDWHAMGPGAKAGQVARAIYGVKRLDGWFRVVSIDYRTLMLPEFAMPSFHARLANSRG